MNDAPTPEDVTQLMTRADGGDLTAASDLLPLVYDELRRLAGARMGDFEDTTTLDPTGLVKGNKLSNLATTGSSWDVFSEISGWKTTAGAGIEVQTNRTLGSIDAHSGQH